MKLKNAIQVLGLCVIAFFVGENYGETKVIDAFENASVENIYSEFDPGGKTLSEAFRISPAGEFPKVNIFKVYPLQSTLFEPIELIIPYDEEVEYDFKQSNPDPLPQGGLTF